jgi:membrane-bound lytic murein transglycosylase F
LWNAFVTRIAFILVLLLAGCGRVPPAPGETGELVVLTLNGPATYFLDAEDTPAGFEYDLVEAFARQQGWSLRFVVADSLADLNTRMARSEAHLAAAALTPLGTRMGGVKAGPVYERLQQWLVCGEAVEPVRTLDALVARLTMSKASLRVEVVAGGSADLWAQGLRPTSVGRMIRRSEATQGELLERVAQGLSDCTVSDNRSLAIEQNYLTGLKQAFELAQPQTLAWVVSPRMESRFARDLERFFAKAEASGVLAQLRERYFGHVARLAEVDVDSIMRLRGERLPALKPHFLLAERQTGIDWRLLAALAYQESQWDRNARSFTSVRGIMMLTEQTADQLGVIDRTDPRESILGGARYLQQLRDALPEAVLEPDRTLFALAAYNIGPGHLDDAMRLARQQGKDPHLWKDLKQVLPALANPRVAAGLAHGYARGGEARALTENVRIYYDILQRYESAPPAGGSWLKRLLKK